MMESETGLKDLLAGMVTGILMGVTVGIVIAPRPGPETRETLEQRALRAKRRAEIMLELAKQRLAKIRMWKEPEHAHG